MDRPTPWLGTLTLALLLCAPLAAQGQISGTAHDFSQAGFSGGQVCIVCHAPHGADVSLAGAPLWNHALTTKTYELYSSATLDSQPEQPTGISKLCLSCHDGTVAIDSFGGNTGTEFVVANAQIGGGAAGLAAEHPISMLYDSELALNIDPGLHDPLVWSSGLGGTINDDMLFNARVECSSCHDVHGSGFEYFLRKSNSGSALCLTCHDK